MRHNRRHRELATGGAQFDPYVADDPIGVEKRLASPQERAEWAKWIVTAPPALPVVTGPRLPKRVARGALATGGVQFDPYAGRVQPGAQERWKYDPVAMRLSAGDLTEEESPMTVRFTSAAHDAMSAAMFTSPYGVFGSDDATTVAVKPAAKSSGGMVALAALGALGIGLGFYLYSKPAAAAPATSPQPVAPPGPNSNVAPPGPNSKAVVTHPVTGQTVVAPVVSHPSTGAPVAVVQNPNNGTPIAVPVARKPARGSASASTQANSPQANSGGFTDGGNTQNLGGGVPDTDYAQVPSAGSGYSANVTPDGGGGGSGQTWSETDADGGGSGGGVADTDTTAQSGGAAAASSAADQAMAAQSQQDEASTQSGNDSAGFDSLS